MKQYKTRLITYVALTGTFFLLNACSMNTKEKSIPEDKTEVSDSYLTIGTKVINPNTVLVTLKPKTPSSYRFFSLSFHKGEEEISLPLKSATQEDKDKSLSLMFEEIDEGKLSLLFYKKSLVSGEKEIYESPFDPKMPFTTVTGKPFGGSLAGIAILMSKKSGRGVIKAPLGDPISYDSQKGYQFLVHFNTKQNTWKILVGIVRINFFHPGLGHVLVSKTFCLQNCDTNSTTTNKES